MDQIEFTIPLPSTAAADLTLRDNRADKPTLAKSRKSTLEIILPLEKLPNHDSLGKVNFPPLSCKVVVNNCIFRFPALKIT